MVAFELGFGKCKDLAKQLFLEINVDLLVPKGDEAEDDDEALVDQGPKQGRSPSPALTKSEIPTKAVATEPATDHAVNQASSIALLQIEVESEAPFGG